MNNDRFRKPVEQGDEMEVTIESTGAKGDGIAKVNNFVVIIPGVKQGDKVRVKITRVLKKMAFAEVIGEGSEKSEESTEETSDEESTEETSDEEASDDQSYTDDEDEE
ncbi:TRAM domain-containing protein [Candidatus Woesearchaeota archaeon]|nr:TRAM domain-containing protein [Candidatus Woesearchaeota archaeon]